MKKKRISGLLIIIAIIIAMLLPASCSNDNYETQSSIFHTPQTIVDEKTFSVPAMNNKDTALLYFRQVITNDYFYKLIDVLIDDCTSEGKGLSREYLVESETVFRNQMKASIIDEASIPLAQIQEDCGVFPIRVIEVSEVIKSEPYYYNVIFWNWYEDNKFIILDYVSDCQYLTGHSPYISIVESMKNTEDTIILSDNVKIIFVNY